MDAANMYRQPFNQTKYVFKRHAHQIHISWWAAAPVSLPMAERKSKYLKLAIGLWFRFFIWTYCSNWYSYNRKRHKRYSRKNPETINNWLKSHLCRMHTLINRQSTKNELRNLLWKPHNAIMREMQFRFSFFFLFCNMCESGKMTEESKWKLLLNQFQWIRRADIAQWTENAHSHKSVPFSCYFRVWKQLNTKRTTKRWWIHRSSLQWVVKLWDIHIWADNLIARSSVFYSWFLTRNKMKHVLLTFWNAL